MCYEGGMPRLFNEADVRKLIAAAVAEAVAPLQARIIELEAEVARLKKNSGNSSKPPSSDIVKPPKPDNTKRAGKASDRSAVSRDMPSMSGNPLDRMKWTTSSSANSAAEEAGKVCGRFSNGDHATGGIGGDAVCDHRVSSPAVSRPANRADRCGTVPHGSRCGGFGRPTTLGGDRFPEGRLPYVVYDHSSILA